MSTARELRRAALRAARSARAELAVAVEALEGEQAGPAGGATERASTVVRRLFAAETAGPEGVLESLGESMDRLRDLLVDLHDHRTAGFDRATEAVARALALLYPARRELERALHPADVPPIPLSGRRREHTPDERRAGPRVELEVDIGFQSETNFFTGFSGDLSDGGIFVATYDVLPLGTPIRVSFVLPGGHHVTVSGRVSWLREPKDLDSDVHPGMGVSFEHLGPTDREAVEAFVRRRAPLFHAD